MKDSKNRLFEIMNKVTGMPLNENFDNNINDDELDWKSRLIKDLEKYNIHLDTNFGNEYFIKCKIRKICVGIPIILNNFLRSKQGMRLLFMLGMKFNYDHYKFLLLLNF